MEVLKQKLQAIEKPVKGNRKRTHIWINIMDIIPEEDKKVLKADVLRNKKSKLSREQFYSRIGIEELEEMEVLKRKLQELVKPHKRTRKRTNTSINIMDTIPEEDEKVVKADVRRNKKSKLSREQFYSRIGIKDFEKMEVLKQKLQEMEKPVKGNRKRTPQCYGYNSRRRQESSEGRACPQQQLWLLEPCSSISIQHMEIQFLR